VIAAAVAEGAGDRGPEVRQPAGLGIDAPLTDGERNRAVGRGGAAAGVDIEVQAVLAHLGRRLHPEPDTGTLTAGIADLVHADAHAVVQPDLAPPVVPGREPFRWRLEHVSQGGRPEAGEQIGVLAVDDKLESNRHRVPIGSVSKQTIETIHESGPSVPS
jgi:hypothetical protein